MMMYLNIKSLYFLHRLVGVIQAGYQRKMSGVSVQSLSSYFKQVPREDKKLAVLSPAHLRFSSQVVHPAQELFVESLLLKI